MTGFHMQTEDRTMKSVNDQPSGNLPFLKPDDIQYFDKLLVSDNRDKITTFYSESTNYNISTCLKIFFFLLFRLMLMSQHLVQKSRKREK